MDRLAYCHPDQGLRTRVYASLYHGIRPQPLSRMDVERGLGKLGILCDKPPADADYVPVAELNRGLKLWVQGTTKKN